MVCGRGGSFVADGCGAGVVIVVQPDQISSHVIGRQRYVRPSTRQNIPEAATRKRKAVQPATTDELLTPANIMLRSFELTETHGL
jgi:hypothetical protein